MLSKNDTPIKKLFLAIQISSFSFVVSVFFKSHTLFRLIRSIVGKELMMMHSCFVLFFLKCGTDAFRFLNSIIKPEF